MKVIIFKIVFFLYLGFSLFTLVWLRAAIVNLEYAEGEINRMRIDLKKEQSFLDAEKIRISLSDDIKPKRIGIVMPGKDSVIYLEGSVKSQVINILNNRLHENPTLIKKVTNEVDKSVFVLTGDWTDVFSIIDTQDEKLSDGLIIFNTPEEMVIGKKERVSAIIIKNHLVDKNKHNIIHADKIKINSIMQMRLTSDSFQITPLSHDEQIIMDTEETIWSWDVIPIESSIQALLLLVSAKLKIPNKEEGGKDYPFIEKNIRVKINPRYTVLQVLKNSWQWIINCLIALLGIMVSAGLFGWFASRRNI